MTQVFCSQCPCPCSRSLLTHIFTGDTQTLKGGSDSVSVGPLGPGAHKVLFEPSKRFQQVWGLILNGISPLLLSCWGFSFALGRGISFYVGVLHFSVNGCSKSSCNFGVLAGEDECMSYSTIFLLENYQSSSMNSVKLQATKLIHRNLLHSYILTTKDHKEKLRKQFHLPQQQKALNSQVCLQRSVQSKLWFFWQSYMYISWTIKKAGLQRIDAFELWCWRRLLRVPWTGTLKPVNSKGNQS